MTARRKAVFIFFAAVAFFGTFLMFSLRPMVAKSVLPATGGAASVWAVCVAVCQLLLLGGYGYAVLVQKSGKYAVFLHSVLICAALAVLPVEPAADFLFSPERPFSSLAKAVTESVGLPFFVLAATSLMIQIWFVQAEGKSPYTLYSFANAGGLAASVAYPLIIEPVMSAQMRQIVWSMAFAVYTVCVCACLLWSVKTVASRVLPLVKPVVKVPASKAAFWVAAAFVPASLMSGVTEYVSSDLPPSPAVWCAPAALYALAFALAFSKWNKDVLSLFAPLRPVAFTVFIAMYVLSFLSYRTALPHWIVSYVMMQFCACVLAESKPENGAMARFYLCVAAGGALGCVFNGIAAPFLFDSHVEYALMFPVAMAFPLPRTEGKKSVQDAWRDFAVPAGVFFLSFGLLAAAHLSGVFDERIAGVVVILMTGGLISATAGNPLRCALTGGVLILFGCYVYFPQNPQSVFHAKILQKRNFFGVLQARRVQSPEGVETLLFQGTTLRGGQYAGNGKNVPQADYAPSSGAGAVFNHLKNRQGASIAVIGMGTASLSAYAERGQKWTYYEIDPSVVSLNTGMSPVFTFFRNFTPDAKVENGDGRVLMGGEGEKYDLIVSDAFSSGSVPVHLITEEAVETYANRLKPEGVLLFHFSRRLSDTGGVLASAARNLNMTGGVSVCETSGSSFPAAWVFLTGSRDAAKALSEAAPQVWRALPEAREKLSWTDDYADVFAAMKRKVRIPSNN